MNALKKYPFHTAAEIFPLADGPDLDALAEDIKKNGLQQPIILLNGSILDGRRRYMACRQAQVTPTFVEFDGNIPPVDFVVSANLHRRHLTTSQGALAGLRILPLLKDDAKERQRLSKGRGRKGAQECATFRGKSADHAAQLVGSSARMIEMAKEVASKRPDLLSQVEEGTISLSEARRELKRAESRRLRIANVPDNFEPTVRLIQGDSQQQLPRLSEQSANQCFTSVPYYLLRDYDCDGQIGLEESVDQWVTRLVDVFREVRRVLRNDGSVWINVGDTYAYGSGSYNSHGRKRKWTSRIAEARRCMQQHSDIHPKSLIAAPHRLVAALIDDGWIKRAEIIVEKNVIDGCKDRPIRTHEYVFILTKSDVYYFDADVLRVPYSTKKREAADPKGQLRGSVWKVGPARDAGDHPAPMPLELAADCIRAGCPEGGTVIDPFLGGGTTAIACVENRRHCIGIDLSPKYLRLAAQRVPGAVIVDSPDGQNDVIPFTPGPEP
jgi:DNA modification methylase